MRVFTRCLVWILVPSIILETLEISGYQRSYPFGRGMCSTVLDVRSYHTCSSSDDGGFTVGPYLEYPNNESKDAKTGDPKSYGAWSRGV